METKPRVGEIWEYPERCIFIITYVGLNDVRFKVLKGRNIWSGMENKKGEIEHHICSFFSDTFTIIKSLRTHKISRFYA